MAISCGIVGLPNVGKSTLFNALSAAGAAVANYPFCTIEPNVGVVPVPDHRLDALVGSTSRKSMVAATVNFVDIAGLVRGASKGEGLGNQFLANIREIDAIAHVVRCFEDDNVVHVEGRIDPVGRRRAPSTPSSVSRTWRPSTSGSSGPRRRSRARRPRTRSSSSSCASGCRPASTPASRCARRGCQDEEQALMREIRPAHARRRSSTSPTSPRSSSATATSDPLVSALRAHASREGAPVVVICAAAEAEIAALDAADRPAFLESLGLKEPGLHAVAQHRLPDLWISSPSSPPARTSAGPGPSNAAPGPRRPRAPSTPTSSAASSRPRSSGGRTSSSCGSEAACRANAKLAARRQGLRRPRRRRHPLQVQRLAATSGLSRDQAGFVPGLLLLVAEPALCRTARRPGPLSGGAVARRPRAGRRRVDGGGAEGSTGWAAGRRAGPRGRGAR